MGNLFRRCVKVRIKIELSFGVVSGVGPGIHVLDGSPRASKGKGLLLTWFAAFLKKFGSIDFNEEMAY